MAVVHPMPRWSSAISVIGPSCRLSVQCHISYRLCHIGPVSCRLSAQCHVGYRSSSTSVIGPVLCRLSVQYHVGCRSDATRVRVGCRSSTMAWRLSGCRHNAISVVGPICRLNGPFDLTIYVGPMVCRLSVEVGSIPPRLNAMSAVGPMPCRFHDVPVIAPIAWPLSIQCHGGRVLSRLSVQYHVGCWSSAISVQ